MIVIIVNNVEGFLDTYTDYEELIGQVTRDCLKYGVVFILSTNGPNTIRYRLRQNFKQNIVLQFNDASDYGSILAGVRKKEPSKVYGRGLISLDNIYEFQTAYAYKEEKLTEYVKIICQKLENICEYQAKPVPVLPEVVTIKLLKDYYTNLSAVPVGVYKETLDIGKINLMENGMYTITGEDISSNVKFITNWIKLLQLKSKCTVIDGNGLLNKDALGEALYASEDQLTNTLENLYQDQDNMNVCIILGLSSMLNKISPTEKTEVTQALDKVKTTSNVKFIIVDVIENIKTLNYELWYKNNTSLSEGIWLGNGIANQFTLKVTTNTRVLRAEINQELGYVIIKGKAYLTKLLSEE